MKAAKSGMILVLGDLPEYPKDKRAKEKKT
jgi:hypothetical protein